MSHDRDHPFVSRAGLKLDHALEAFGIDVAGLACADFGCNVGGFTDCLLRRGAASVAALDTGYGTLDYRLRMDERVGVRERTNALYVEPPATPVDLVVVDLGWTPQHRAVPAALRWIDPAGRIVSLIKPHYELTAAEKASMLVDGRLAPADAERIRDRVLESMPALGAVVIDHCRSPITGGKSGRRKGDRGNVEYLVHLAPR